MEYAKDERFKVKYNAKMDRLEINKEKGIIGLLKKIKKNKFITTVITAFIMFSILNIAMIYSFIKILQNT